MLLFKGKQITLYSKYRHLKWPEEIHDEVLARLLALNAQRAEEERLAGATNVEKTVKKISTRGRKKHAASNETTHDSIATNLFS